jgi:hypothetical protein
MHSLTAIITTLIALLLTLSIWSASPVDAKQYPRLIRNAFIDGCKPQCDKETDELIKTSCHKACDCTLLKIEDRLTLEEFIIYLDEEGAPQEPAYAGIAERAKAITDQCVDEIIEQNRLGTQ